MGKKSRRKRADKWAHIDTREADAAKRDALDFLKGYAFKEEEEESTPWVCAATHERRRRRAVIAAAEAEFRAAIAAIPPRDDNEEVKIYEDARCIQALSALTRAVTIDEDDKKTMGEYLTKSAARAHWSAHRSQCFEKFHENVKQRRAQGESAARIRQEFLEWYGISVREDKL